MSFVCLSCLALLVFFFKNFLSRAGGERWMVVVVGGVDGVHKDSLLYDYGGGSKRGRERIEEEAKGRRRDGGRCEAACDGLSFSSALLFSLF